MKIDHIGYVVKDIEKGKKSMQILGYVFGETIDDKDRNIYISFGELDGYRIELVAPSEKLDDNSLATYLSKIGPTP